MRSSEYGTRDHEMGDTFLEVVHEKAKQIMEMNRVELEDFDGFYPSAKLAADQDYIDEKKKLMMESTAEKAKKMSEVMEAILIDPKVIRSWYGFTDEEGRQLCEVNAMGTSELDDYANGVDAVWELKHLTEGTSHLALGVDVTFSSDFEEKIKYIKGGIDNGQMAKVEYFFPKWGDVKGEMANIPQVVIGADAQHLTELALLWSKAEERKQEIEVHPMQRLILEEIMYQLPVYEKYARKFGKDEIADKIAVTINKFKKLYDIAIDKVAGYQDFIEDDKVFAHLKDYLQKFDEIESKSPSGKLRANVNAKHGL